MSPYRYVDGPGRNSWLPAEQQCPELVTHLMHMSTYTHNGVKIEQYKHRRTPRYINLDYSGQAWEIVVDANTGEIGARHITLEQAKIHVLG